MLLPQGTILPNFYFFSIFLQKLLKALSVILLCSKGVGTTPPTPPLLFFAKLYPNY